MSVVEAWTVVLGVFSAIYILRSSTDEEKVQGDSTAYPYRLSRPSDADIQRFSGGDEEGVSDEVY